jgi:hypothetical protein
MRRAVTPELRKIMGDDFQLYKGLVPFLDVAMDDWKRYARDLLGHKNPYTGMTWAEDPALIAVCPVNEDTLWAQLKKPALQKIAQEAFSAWLADEKKSDIQGPERVILFNQFVVMKHQAADREMRRFLKEDLGYQGLLTGNNWKNLMAQTPLRETYDYVDNHGYWDHPSFPGASFQHPFNYSQRSATAALAEIPRRIFLSRVAGKPFAVTEYNFSLPNQYRSESGALAGAYAARQDWDLMYRFAWSHNDKTATETGPSRVFDMSTDPINRLAEIFVDALWFRGDMEPFEEESVFVVNREMAFAGGDIFDSPADFPVQASLLGLEKKVSSRFDENADSASLNQEFTQHQKKDRYEVDTGNGRTVIDVSGDFLAETPDSKSMVLQSGSLDTEFISKFSGGPASVLIMSRDQQSLEQSRRLLVLHLTDVLSEGMKFDSKQRFSVMSDGMLPHLIRSGKATMHLPNHFSEVTAYAIGINGERQEEVPVRMENNQLTIELNTTPEGKTPRMIYEIVRNP